LFVQATVDGKVTVSDWVRGKEDDITDDKCVSTYLFCVFYVLSHHYITGCCECDVVYHLFITDIWTASEMTFITVHLVIPGLDILFIECTDS